MGGVKGEEDRKEGKEEVGRKNEEKGRVGRVKRELTKVGGTARHVGIPELFIARSY